MRYTLTTCPYCGCGCNFYLVTQGQDLIGVLPCNEHHVSRGALCIKGWNSWQFVQHPDRCTKPLIKENGFFRETTWEEALSFVVKKLRSLQTEYGNDAIAFFSSAKATNEENYLLQKLARAVFKTNNVDHCARLCHSSTVVGLVSTFGSGAMTNSINDIEEAEVILVTGSNTTEQHPLIGTRIINAVQKGAKLILADNRKIQLSKFATIHLRQRNGTDVAWLNCFMNVIIAENLADLDFINEHTENFAALKEIVKKYTPEYAAEVTGIPAEQLREAALLYGKAKAATLIYSMGITQHSHGVDNVTSCANLSMLTGNIGRLGTGVNPLRGQNNVQGACDMGALPNVYTGYRTVTDDEVRKEMETAWNVNELPATPGYAVTTAIQAAAEQELKGLFIMGENPMLSDPDINFVKEALAKLEFLVVQDIFLTETAQLADVFLPAASYAEKDGTFTNTERSIQRVRQAIEPLGDSRPDWQVLCNIAEVAGYKHMDYNHPEEIFEEIRAVTPIYAGINYKRIEEDVMQWPCPDILHPGTPVLHGNGNFSRGKGCFVPADYKPPMELPDEEYDFTLTTGRMYYHYHTGTMTRRTTALHREVPEPYVEINPFDADTLGIRDGEMVHVSSRRGEISLKAKVSDIVPAKVAFIPFHFCEAAANVLTNRALDPIAKIPEYKVCAVKIRLCS
jgi:formate dehydrogenase alpha subunit